MKKFTGYVIASTLLIVGCMSIKKATDKVIADKSATNKVLALHPCKPVSDSIISHTDTLTTHDTITNVGYFIDSVTKWRYDTVVRNIRTVKVIHTIDTIFAIDQRKLDVMNNSISIRDSQIVGLKQSLEDETTHSKDKDKWLYLFIGLFTLVCVYIAFKLFTR
jgi:hypothetical protein